MRRSLTAILVGGTLALLAAPASAEVQIVVDKSSQHMSVTVDGQPRYSWPVSTGVADYDTPSGGYKPFRMEASHFSREWDNAPMPHAIFFTQIGHAIHGTNQVRSLGRAASHGCVRLSPGNAATLFALIKAQGMANTRVTIEGGVPDQVAGGRERGYRTARQPRNYDVGDVVSAGMQSGREPVQRRRAAPAYDPYDPYAGSWYGGPTGGFEDY